MEGIGQLQVTQECHFSGIPCTHTDKSTSDQPGPAMYNWYNSTLATLNRCFFTHLTGNETEHQKIGMTKSPYKAKDTVRIGHL